MKKALLLITLILFMAGYVHADNIGPPEYEKIGLYEVPQLQADVQVLETPVYISYYPVELFIVESEKVVVTSINKIYERPMLFAIKDYPLLCYSKSNFRLLKQPTYKRLMHGLEYSQLGYSIRSVQNGKI